MNQYFLSSIAENDIDEIISYIALENQAAASKFLNKLFETFDMLSRNPMIGHTRKDITDKPVRFWSFKSRYLIIYLDCNRLELVIFLNGYRNLSMLLD